MYQQPAIFRQDGLALPDLSDHLLPKHFLSFPRHLAPTSTLMIHRQMTKAKVLKLQAKLKLPHILL